MESINNMDNQTNTTEPIKPSPSDPLKEVKEKLTNDEKEAFFKAFLSDKSYVADESLFNGKVPVKLKTLTVLENNLVLLQMQYDRDTGDAQDTDRYLIRVIMYRLAASLLALDNKPFAANITPESHPADNKLHTTYLLERLKLMDDWPTFKISSLTDAFNRFEKKVRALTEESFKLNF